MSRECDISCLNENEALKSSVGSLAEAPSYYLALLAYKKYSKACL